MRGMMNINTARRRSRLFHIALAAVLAITFVAVVGAQENTGKVQRGLVGGTVASAEPQEQYGLVTLSVGCSGSLLRNNWVITAAHCIDNPDPANPGQFIIVPENGCVAKIILDAGRSSPALTLCCDLEETRDKFRLRYHISSFNPLDLPFVHHV